MEGKVPIAALRRWMMPFYQEGSAGTNFCREMQKEARSRLRRTLPCFPTWPTLRAAEPP